MTIEDLKIEPEFRDLIPKLTDAEFAQLEKNILEDGRVREPIVVWNGIIIDGHHRYYILQKHPEIKDYKIENKEFSNNHEALAWACANQLGRRNLNPNDAAYLRGTQLDETRLSNGGNRGNQYTKVAEAENRLLPKETAREKIAKQNGVSENTIMHDDWYVKGIKAAEEVIPGVKAILMHGEKKIPRGVVEKISKVTPDKQRKATIALSEGKIDDAKIALGMKKEPEPDPEPEPYNIDDLIEEMKAAASDLHFALNQTLIVMHKEALSNKQNREKAIDGLRDIMDDIQEFIETLYEMED